jgi:uncharacterized protein (TIGR03084 family)
MAADLGPLRVDLDAEQRDLDDLVAPLDPAAWATPTPAEGWSIHDQVAHLAFFDGSARQAVTDPAEFAAELGAIAADPSAYMEAHLDRGRAMSPRELLSWWRAEREALLGAVDGLDPAARLPWYGPPMGAASFLSARLMEAWCHGQDVADALGAVRRPTARLRHVAHLGVRTRGFSYSIHGREVPAGEVYVDLRSPDGETWSSNDPSLPDSVRGSALDFCLVVTQRRHPADTELVATGPLAEEWMALAQAFAGTPGSGRKPGQFARTSPSIS